MAEGLVPREQFGIASGDGHARMNGMGAQRAGDQMVHTTQHSGVFSETVARVSPTQHHDITEVSHKYNPGTTQVHHRYVSGYHTGIISLARRYRLWSA